MKIKLDDGAIMPKRAHETDAGLDLMTPANVYLHGNGSSIEVDTGVHIAIPHGCFGLITSKSGLFFNDDILTTGTIDEGYTGSVRVKLVNFGNKLKIFKVGDKIAQLIIMPCFKPPMELVIELDGTERGANGFGSTGR